jgi:hypothetical protein
MQALTIRKGGIGQSTFVSFAHIWTKSGAGRSGAVPPGRPKRDGVRVAKT